MIFNARANVANESEASEAIMLAEISLPKASMRSSAEHCLNMACKFMSERKYGYAHEWACQSLRYSVGTASGYYVAAWRSARDEK